MTKIKTLGVAVLLIATVGAPVFAQERGEPESRHRLQPPNSAESERPRPDSGMRNSEKTEPGDFAVTDGLSGRGRTGTPSARSFPAQATARLGTPPASNCARHPQKSATTMLAAVN
jgi:hypothetical protein